MVHKICEVPEYIQKLLPTVSFPMTIEKEIQICKVITESEQYFREHRMYIHFIMQHSASAKINSEIYKILKDYYPTPEYHKNAVDYWLQYATIDREFIIMILENSPIIPDLKSINALLLRSIKLEYKLFNEILDIFILYGLTVNKKLIIDLLEFKYKINSIEKIWNYN